MPSDSQVLFTTMILSLKRVDASGRTTHGDTCTQEGYFYSVTALISSSSSLSKHDERITGYWRHRETLRLGKGDFHPFQCKRNAYAIQGTVVPVRNSTGC